MSLGNSPLLRLLFILGSESCTCSSSWSVGHWRGPGRGPGRGRGRERGHCPTWSSEVRWSSLHFSPLRRPVHFLLYNFMLDSSVNFLIFSPFFSCSFFPFISWLVRRSCFPFFSPLRFEKIFIWTIFHWIVGAPERRAQRRNTSWQHFCANFDAVFIVFFFS